MVSLTTMPMTTRAAWHIHGRHVQKTKRCLQFFQLNNYPTFTKFINAPLKQYTITDSLTFVKSQIQAAAQAQNPVITGVIINFHNFASMTPEDETKLIQALTGPYKIWAIVISHNFPDAKLLKYLCINGRQVPMLYSGTLSANQYLIGQFETNSPGVDKVPPFYYKVTVKNDKGESVMEKLSDITYNACT